MKITKDKHIFFCFVYKTSSFVIPYQQINRLHLFFRFCPFFFLDRKFASRMARIFLISFLAIYLLFISQIDESTAYILTRSEEYPPVFPVLPLVITDDSSQVIRSSMDKISHHDCHFILQFDQPTDQQNNKPWLNWYPKERHVKKRMLCFFNTVTCFG